MGGACIFVGPSLSGRLLDFGKMCGSRESGRDSGIEGKITFLPPVAEGDILRALKHSPSVIGIIDGFFENVPSVWHKEILFALSSGVHVLGASSMGAIRAAELHQFGMRGIGEVFELFKSQILEDDDEVTVAHAPEELGFVPTSEAMVNIRATFYAALKQNIVSNEEFTTLLNLAKKQFYKDRTFKEIFSVALKNGVPSATVEKLSTWVAENRVDQKRQDAVLLVNVIQGMLDSPISPHVVSFLFEDSAIWLNSKSGDVEQHA